MEYDVIVIGGGPGGYVAAIKAAQLGFKVACIEKRGSLGGTCLNVGCIPSKTLLNSSHKYRDAHHNFKKIGINVNEISLDLKMMMSNKTAVITDLCKGIEGLFKKNKVDYFQGLGKIKNKNQVEITLNQGNVENLFGKNIIIATGSESSTIPNVTIDEERVVSSTGALALTSVPKTMIVVGGGYIGLEMGSVWNNLGSKVTVIEYANKILPLMDTDISKEAHKILAAQGMEFKTNTKLLSVIRNQDTVTIECQNLDSQKIEKSEADVVLIAVGRKPYTKDLGLESVNIATDTRGFVQINEHWQTNVSNIYAIGDVVCGPMLAHKAEEEGVAVAEFIAGQKPHINYDLIPGVVYTHPEIASIGKSEDELKKSNIEYKVGKFPLLANSRARAVGETEGFVKIIVCKKTDTILGAHIVGSHAGELIMSLAVGMEFKAAAEDIARTCHAHPSFAEAIKEAALAAFFKPIHM